MNPGDPQRCQETARLEKNRCFGEHRQRRFLSFEITSQMLRKNSGMPLGEPWTIPDFLIFFDQIDAHKSLVTRHFEFSQTSGTVQKII